MLPFVAQVKERNKQEKSLAHTHRQTWKETLM